MGTISLRLQPLRIFERYVLRQVTAPLLTAMLVGLLILVAERLVIVLAETMGKKNSFSIVFELISYWLPHYAGLAGPAEMYPASRARTVIASPARALRRAARGPGNTHAETPPRPLDPGTNTCPARRA